MSFISFFTLLSTLAVTQSPLQWHYSPPHVGVKTVLDLHPSLSTRQLSFLNRLHIWSNLSTIDHCWSRCKGREGLPLIHSFISMTVKRLHRLIQILPIWSYPILILKLPEPNMYLLHVRFNVTSSNFIPLNGSAIWKAFPHLAQSTGENLKVVS
jgi:hypothetical protein